MASIPLPALDIRPQQPPDTLGSIQKLMALRSLGQQQQLQQQQMTSNQQEQAIRDQQIKDQQATTAAMKSWDGQDYDTLAKSVLQNGGSANAAQAIQLHGLGVKKAVSDIAAQDATTGSKNLETYIGRHKAIGDALEGIENVPDDQLHDAATQKVQELAKSGILAPQDAQQALQGIQQVTDPAQLRQHIDILAKSSMGAMNVATQQKTLQETATSKAQEGEATASADQKRTESAYYAAHGGAPGVPAEVLQQNDWLSKNPGKGPSDYAIAMKKIVPAFNFSLQSGMLTDPAKDMAAENYYQTGQLPAGARSPAMISQIINRAGELHPGGNLAGNKAAYDANQKSYDNVTSTLDTLSGFQNAGLKNLKQFTDLADKLPDTGVPWINTPVRLLNNKLVGDEWMPAVEAARSVALREIARVTNDPRLRGVLTDSARQEVEAFSPQNATMNQIKHVVDVLENDMANVHQGLAQQKQDIGKRLNIADASGQNNAQPTTPAPTGKSVSIAAAATKTYQGHTYTQQSDGSWKLTQ